LRRDRALSLEVYRTHPISTGGFLSPSASRVVFVNLPVKDVAASKVFFRALGFDVKGSPADDLGVTVIISEFAYVTLLSGPHFAEFTTRETADAERSTEVIIGISAESPAEVDALVDAALLLGASAGRAAVTGSVYVRSFHDPDGHLWEVSWMSPDGPVAEPQGR
jgi:predicted lactoylglutathione lyase